MISIPPLWTARLRAGLAHPLAWLGALLIVTQVCDDDWYPFSDFPMYSGFAAEARYLVLQDANGQPITPLRRFTGESASRLAKRYYRELTTRAERTHTAPTDALRADCAASVIQEIRKISRQRRHPLPARLRLVEITIRRLDTGIVETPHLLLAE
jgi:hypothetical protein